MGKRLGTRFAVCSQLKIVQDQWLSSRSMTRMILSGTLTAVALGLGLSGISASIYGTAGLPFVVFASFGFVFGVLGW